MIARARATGVLALGVLALHELSYLLTGGEPAAAHAEHAYLAAAVPVVVMLATALVAVSLLAPLGGGPVARGSLGAAPRALLYAGLLLGAYFVQEVAEGVFDPAGGGAFAALAEPGAIVAFPLALCLGALAARLTRGLEDVEGLLAAAQTDPPRVRPAAADARRPSTPAPRRSAAGASLAFGFARRPPPPALPA